ncbi:hypothetical protein THAOC_37861 [Thalassiosira oceanica]|uniref:MULE transposase domain-containing protein n=1 Tax=Thalassiosira oceanica TaxID=159749 RepID=K0RB35_THAOC|nr:hypothetical protein THAOC_37861 [Thalassiosira oceanica]|eukprot:EJK43672.1 hypothetical protein THAOC_37861 [Thalassiosira oceanica]
MDDSRSGINTSGFCFWNLVIVDADGKVGVVLGAMTMSASAEAITWVLQCLKEMSGFDLSGITVVMSDLGATEDAIKSALPSVKACLVCTWHIMAIDFPTNLH